MPGTIKLSELPAGASAIIREHAAAGAASVRLREMGLLPGTRISFTRAAPLGDPLEFKVRGYSLTLRRADAAGVLVEPVEK